MRSVNDADDDNDDDVHRVHYGYDDLKKGDVMDGWKGETE